MKPRKIAYALLASAFVLGWTANFANAEDPPKDNKGFTSSKATVVELGPEFDGMAGRQLRLRLLTIEPGGHIGLHTHKDRPAVIYFL
jgi:quercetin dioxygenase-like cupin family protein